MEIENLIIDNENIEEAKLYIDELKGKFLYLHVIKIFKSRFNEQNFNYKEISSFIRHDKALRDVLYRYFSMVEEKYRTLLLKQIDIKSKKKKFKELVYTKEINKTESKLYFLIQKKMSFNDLIKIFEINKLLNKDKIDTLKKLIKVRNFIMHHNLILVQDSIEWKKVENNIEILRESLKILYQELPERPESYRKGFIKSINSLLKKDTPYFTRINIGEIKCE